MSIRWLRRARRLVAATALCVGSVALAQWDATGASWTLWSTDAGTPAAGAILACPIGGCEPPPDDPPPEICNGIDDDGNGLIDDGLPVYTYYRDLDGDGHGAAASGTIQSCMRPAGYSVANDDCDDRNPAVVHTATYYRDADGDGYGNPAVSGTYCGQPAGYVANNTDCNDADPAIRPGLNITCGIGECRRTIASCVNGAQAQCQPGAPTAETCDGKDNDCDGTVDNMPPVSCGVGACQRTVTSCSYNCDDEVDDHGVHHQICLWERDECVPGAPTAEVCNGIDDNCNGQVDEGVKTTFFVDRDHDGHGVPSGTTQACSPPPGYAAIADDCDDRNAAVHPGATEQCDGIDNNCDHRIDEGGVCRVGPTCQ